MDINPGDRESECLGLMEPVRLEMRKNEQVIVYRCVKCAHEKRNRTAEGDNFDELLKIPKKQLLAREC